MDQFYTNSDVASRCYNTLKEFININNYDIHLEPSAGRGAFMSLMEPSKRVGLDIEPHYDGVTTMDFFDYEHVPDKTYLVIGNPPFGRVSSTAVKFFNKSAQFADCIAFIIPRTFKRVSIQNKLDLNFKLVHSEDLPQGSKCFTPPMDAKCCWQIWMRSPQPRGKVIYATTHKDFTFVRHGPKDSRGQPTPPPPGDVDFAIKAYGSGCGAVRTADLPDLRPKSWHWIKSTIDPEVLRERFGELDYSMSRDTVRQDSLGQQELINLYSLQFD